MTGINPCAGFKYMERKGYRKGACSGFLTKVKSKFIMDQDEIWNSLYLIKILNFRYKLPISKTLHLQQTHFITNLSICKKLYF